MGLTPAQLETARRLDEEWALGLELIEASAEATGVEFHPAHGEVLRLLRRSGFEVLDLVELFASDASTDHPFHSYVTAEWARGWPAEEIWRARKRRTIG